MSEPAQRANPARLEELVRQLVGFGPRDEAHPETMAKVADFLEHTLRELGAPVRQQPYTVAGVSYANVVARFGPDDGPLTILGAHYDTCGPLPGADDNASGVAGLVEVARLYAKDPPKGPVLLVAYANEEPPSFHTSAMGSRVHARALAAEGRAVRAMISIEMIGYFTDAPGTQHFPVKLLRFLYPTTGNFIAVVGKLGQGRLVRAVQRAMRGALRLPVRALVAPAALVGVDFSDHASFWTEGFEAAMVTDTAFYRNPHYHQPTDTPERLDYARMAQVVDGLAAAGRALSAP